MAFESDHTVLNRNLSIMATCQPLVHRILSDFSGEVRYIFSGSQKGTDDVLHCLNKAGKHIQYSSFFDPEKEAAEYLAELDTAKYSSLYVLNDITNGHTLRLLLKMANLKDYVVCIERDTGLLKDILSRFDFTADLSKRLFFITGGLDEISGQVISLFEENEHLITKGVQFINLPICDEDFITYYDEADRIFSNTGRRLLLPWGTTLMTCL